MMPKHSSSVTIDFHKRFLTLAFLCVFFIVPMAYSQVSIAPYGARASDEKAAVGKGMQFDVVSIRPSKPGSPQGTTTDILPDGYHAKGQSLWTTIMVAYYPQSSAYWGNDRLVGLPSWGIGDLYDIDAKVSPSDIAKWQKQGPRHEMLQAMLQAVLTDRCKLVLRRTMTEGPDYALVVGKHGAKLKEAPPDEPIPHPFAPLPGGGGLVPYKRGETPKLTFYSTSMSQLADHLSKSSRLPILDKTGLKGKYDFVLTWQGEGNMVVYNPDAPDAPAPWGFDDLGLKLVPIKAPTMTMVVGHIEKPSAN